MVISCWVLVVGEPLGYRGEPKKVASGVSELQRRSVTRRVVGWHGGASALSRRAEESCIWHHWA
ncbi:MAG: hypothetical protein ICV78_08470 [Tolypothrix sp. Co-bin9]|nr:hypothetical protein [Tolypothrix sp. Co-bin9]